MNPITEAAVIAASSTGVVAIVGYLVNLRTTTRSLGSAATLSQDERLWQRRADVYAEIFAYCGHRREVRNSKFRPGQWSQAAKKMIQADLDAYAQPEWFGFQGRVLAFGSDEVSRAFIAAHGADDRLWIVLRDTTAGRDPAAAYPAGPYPGTLALPADIRALLAKADQADQSLIELIRRELLGSPRARGQRFMRLHPTPEPQAPEAGVSTSQGETIAPS